MNESIMAYLCVRESGMVGLEVGHFHSTERSSSWMGWGNVWRECAPIIEMRNAPKVLVHMLFHL